MPGTMYVVPCQAGYVMNEGQSCQPAFQLPDRALQRLVPRINKHKGAQFTNLKNAARCSMCETAGYRPLNKNKVSIYKARRLLPEVSPGNASRHKHGYHT